jgi:hypothetical protein
MPHVPRGDYASIQQQEHAPGQYGACDAVVNPLAGDGVDVEAGAAYPVPPVVSVSMPHGGFSTRRAKWSRCDSHHSPNTPK